jgi:hypothetical protein
MVAWWVHVTIARYTYRWGDVVHISGFDNLLSA